MDGLKPPQTLSLDSRDLSRTWKTWREEFMLYADLTVPVNDEEKRVKLFRYLVGESGRELLGKLMGDVAGDAWKLDDILEKFHVHCNPNINETVERYRFFTRQQGSSENIDSYVTELKLMTKTCNFGTLRDSLIRDRIVCGLHDAGMRERLLGEKNLTLDTCIQLCRAAELSRDNSEATMGPKEEEVCTLQGAMHQGQKHIPQQQMCKEEEELCLQERESSLDQEEPEPTQDVVCELERCDDATRVAVENEAEMDRQRRILDAVWNPYILLHRIDVPQQHMCKEEKDEQQHCHQERKFSLDQEESESPEMKEEQDEEWIKQEDSDTSALKLHICIHTDVPQQHVCKEEEDEQQLCRQERKSNPDQEEPEPPQMKEEQEGECIKEEETDSVIMTPTQEESKDREAYGQDEHSEITVKSNPKFYLDSHLNINTGEKPHTCTMCNKSCRDKYTLTVHMRTHTGEKPYVCPTCGKRFICKSSLTQHTFAHTGIKLYTCGTCEKSFHWKSSFVVHLKTHTVEKSHNCTVCNKSFRVKGDLTVHMRTHTGEKPYSCSTCGKRFCTKTNLTNHIVIHTGTKQYTCDTCGSSFKHKCSFQKHMKIHTGVKPHTCTVCNKSFRLKYDLRVHMRRHEKGVRRHKGEKPYTCKTCNKRYCWETQLNRHILTHTSSKPQTFGTSFGH